MEIEAPEGDEAESEPVIIEQRLSASEAEYEADASIEEPIYEEEEQEGRLRRPLPNWFLHKQRQQVKDEEAPIFTLKFQPRGNPNRQDHPNHRRYFRIEYLFSNFYIFTISFRLAGVQEEASGCILVPVLIQRHAWPKRKVRLLDKI